MRHRKRNENNTLQKSRVFLKISKEISKAWWKSLIRAKRASGRVRREKKKTSLPCLALCFQPCSRPFVWLLVRTWIRKNTNCFVVYGNKEERKCDNRNVTETWSFAFRRGHMSRPWKTYIAYSTFLRRPHDQHDLNGWNRLWKTRSPYFRRRKLDGYKQLYVSVEFTK